MSSAKVQRTGLPSAPAEACQQHAVGLDAAHLSWREVRDDHNFAADEIFRRISERDSRQHLADFVANVHGQLKQLVGALDAFRRFHHADSPVRLSQNRQS